MTNRRAAMRMTDEEALAFLEAQRTVICATNGRDGFPHLMREVLKEAGDAAVLEPADAREAVLAVAEGLLAPSVK